MPSEKSGRLSWPTQAYGLETAPCSVVFKVRDGIFTGCSAWNRTGELFLIPSGFPVVLGFHVESWEGALPFWIFLAVFGTFGKPSGL